MAKRDKRNALVLFFKIPNCQGEELVKVYNFHARVSRGGDRTLYFSPVKWKVLVKILKLEATDGNWTITGHEKKDQDRLLSL